MGDCDSGHPGRTSQRKWVLESPGAGDITRQKVVHTVLPLPPEELNLTPGI